MNASARETEFLRHCSLNSGPASIWISLPPAYRCAHERVRQFLGFERSMPLES